MPALEVLSWFRERCQHLEHHNMAEPNEVSGDSSAMNPLVEKDFQPWVNPPCYPRCIRPTGVLADQRHEEWHEGKRPHRCEIPSCQDAYRTLNDLYQHTRHTHRMSPKQPGIFRCEHCDRDFEYQGRYNRHVRDGCLERDPKVYGYRGSTPPGSSPSVDSPLSRQMGAYGPQLQSPVRESITSPNRPAAYGPQTQSSAGENIATQSSRQPAGYGPQLQSPPGESVASQSSRQPAGYDPQLQPSPGESIQSSRQPATYGPQFPSPVRDSVSSDNSRQPATYNPQIQSLPQQSFQSSRQPTIYGPQIQPPSGESAASQTQSAGGLDRYIASISVTHCERCGWEWSWLKTDDIDDIRGLWVCKKCGNGPGHDAYVRSQGEYVGPVPGEPGQGAT